MMNDEHHTLEQIIEDVSIIHDYYIHKARCCYYFLDFLKNIQYNNMSSDILDDIVYEELAEWLKKV